MFQWQNKENYPSKNVPSYPFSSEALTGVRNGLEDNSGECLIYNVASRDSVE